MPAPLSVAAHAAPSVPMSSCPDLFRASTSCSIAVRAGRGRGGGGTWMPGTSPGMTEETSRAADGIPGNREVPRRAPPRHADPRIGYADPPLCRARTVGICRRQCRQAGRVGKGRHSRSASAGRECRPGRDLPTRCLCRRQKPTSGPAGRHAPCPQIQAGRQRTCSAHEGKGRWRRFRRRPAVPRPLPQAGGEKVSRGVGSSVPSPRRGEGRGEGEIPLGSRVERIRGFRSRIRSGIGREKKRRKNGDLATNLL